MQSNLLEIGKIVKSHGIKGAVKIVSYLDDVNFSIFKTIYLGLKKQPAKITGIKPLNNDAYSVTIDIIKDVNAADAYKNQSVFVDRSDYPELAEKVYLSDLIGAPVCDENGNKLGELLDYDDYGASIILTIKCGAVSYQIPYVDEVITYNRTKNCFEIDKQTFIDVRV